MRARSMTRSTHPHRTRSFTSLTGDPGPGVLAPEDHALVTWRCEDLRDAGAVHDALDASAPDAVFHLADGRSRSRRPGAGGPRARHVAVRGPSRCGRGP